MQISMTAYVFGKDMDGVPEAILASCIFEADIEWIPCDAADTVIAKRPLSLFEITWGDETGSSRQLFQRPGIGERHSLVKQFMSIFGRK